MNPIKKYRWNLDMTQKELADKVGVRPATICSWENDKTFPSFENLQRLGRALKIDPGVFAIDLHRRVTSNGQSHSTANS